jgi:uncharacterized membrane protein
MTIAENAAQDFPTHVEETIESIRRLHVEHQVRASPQQRAVAKFTALIARPGFALGLFLAAAAWVAINALLSARGLPAFDRPPFPWTQGAMTLASLFLVILVLAAQKHEDELDQKRELLTLELAILGEQKAAKMIRLLEELRRDSPQIHDRRDHEAEAMAQPADPQTVLDAIEEAR